MDIGQAVTHLRRGGRVARHGWNGKGMWLELQTPDEHSKMTTPYVFITTPRPSTADAPAHTQRVPWLASQTDLLATDWHAADADGVLQPEADVSIVGVLSQAAVETVDMITSLVLGDALSAHTIVVRAIREALEGSRAVAYFPGAQEQVAQTATHAALKALGINPWSIHQRTDTNPAASQPGGGTG